MTHVLLTGARGFVGKATLSQLIEQNLTITAVSRKLNGSERSDANWIERNISPDTNWSDALRNIDTVIHLADGLRAFEKPNKNTPPNLDKLIAATLHLAEAAISAKVKRFVYISSIKAAAGETAKEVLSETSTPSPKTDYGKAKRKCERAMLDLFKNTQTDLIIIRNPIVYGPGGTNNMARFLALADSPWPLPFASMSNARSMISAKNLGNALATVAKSPSAEPGLYFVHDQAGGLSTSEILKSFRAKLGRPSRLFPIPQVVWKLTSHLPLIGKFVRRLAGTLQIDDEAFRKTFGWEPPQSSSDAMHEMVEYYLASRPR